MPGVPKDTPPKPVIAGAICAPPSSNVQQQEANGNANTSGDHNDLPHPRQPTSLQGLLRFAMEATKSEDAPSESRYQQMDEERRRFLEEALKSMTVDVMEVLQEQIRILQGVSNVSANEDVSKYTEAIETILEYVDQIDIANDFHKIGGFVILQPCLKCEHPMIRKGGCDLLAELCQNNPYCQRVILDNEFMPLLLQILEKEDDEQVILKGLYALSAIVRDSLEGFSQLIHYKGLETLKKVLQRKQEKCVIKITFLLGALCRTQPDVKSRLIFLDFLPILISLISGERKPYHEHVLSLLVSLIEGNPTAISECRNPKHDLKDILQSYLTLVKNREECLEEEQYCMRLLQIIFNVN